eukprot:gnl/Dysnectes_brevis/1266_a1420_3161.p1 GENE.gnl/Dysnectes_brevis/1266_a1420_3161~~gnl/Dysnectes_brevis/1266_a1420_3161.p1  ORF type:complete len:158 (+),score=30.06 gnl/Dysnectes_brevis/1266_a1420_3161:23-496(+)
MTPVAKNTILSKTTESMSLFSCCSPENDRDDDFDESRPESRVHIKGEGAEPIIIRRGESGPACMEQRPVEYIEPDMFERAGPPGSLDPSHQLVEESDEPHSDPHHITLKGEGAEPIIVQPGEEVPFCAEQRPVEFMPFSGASHVMTEGLVEESDEQH